MPNYEKIEELKEKYMSEDAECSKEDILEILDVVEDIIEDKKQEYEEAGEKMDEDNFEVEGGESIKGVVEKYVKEYVEDYIKELLGEYKKDAEPADEEKEDTELDTEEIKDLIDEERMDSAINQYQERRELGEKLRIKGFNVMSAAKQREAIIQAAFPKQRLDGLDDSTAYELAKNHINSRKDVGEQFRAASNRADSATASGKSSYEKERDIWENDYYSDKRSVK